MSEEMKYYYLRNHPLLASLSEQKLKEAAMLARVRTVYRGEIIDYGETGLTKIHFLVKGKVKITDSDNSENEMVKDILTQPDVFGDLGLEGSLRATEGAEALTANTIIVSFYAKDFKKIMEENPLMALDYAKEVTGKLKRLEDRHAALAFQDAKYRLISFIKYWAHTDGNNTGDKIILNNYLTHSDIAGFIATSRQSVNMLLNELKSSGLLSYTRRKIELNNPLTWN